MKYFLDTEFYEDGERIHLISIGIAAEDGRGLYYEDENFDWNIVPADHWIQTNVRPHLTQGIEATDRSFIAHRVRNFCLRMDKGKPEFYGYFADYDWVVLCQLFGRMVDLPEGFPYFCMDLKQMMVERGLTKEWKQENCPDPEGEHNAFVDADWNKRLYSAIMKATPAVRP